MIPPTGLRNLARILVLLLAALAPLTLGRLVTWEPLVLLLVSAGACALWVAGGGQLLPKVWGLPDRLLGMALAASVFVTRFSVSLYDSLLYMAMLLAGLLLMFLARAALTDAKWNARAWWALSGGAFAAGLWGLREYTTTALLASDATWRSFGPFYNPNCLGGYMALLFLIPLALAFGANTRAGASQPKNTGKRKGEKRPEPEDAAPRYPEIAAVTMAGVVGLALMATGSKGAMLAVLAAAIVFAFLGAPRGTALGRALRLGAVAMVAVGILAALTFPPIRNRVLSAFSGQKESGSFRVYTWQGTVDMIKARPATGFGPGAFAQAFPRFARAGFTRMAHQTPLQLASETGVVTTGLLLGGILASLVYICTWMPGLPTHRRLLCAAAVAATAGLWVHNLVDYTWYLAAMNGASWLLLGLAWPTQDTADPGEYKPHPRAVLSGAAALALIAMLSSFALYCEAQLASGRRYASMGAMGLAEERLRKALPMHPARWTELSKLYEYLGAAGDVEKLDQAYVYRAEALKRQPTEPTHYNALGRLARVLARASSEDKWLERAEEWLQRGREVYPTSTEILANLGRALEEIGKPGEALDVYRELVALYDTPVRTAQAIQYFVDENYAFAWAPLAEDALTKGNRREAHEFASSGLEVAVTHLAAQARYRDMFEITGRYDATGVAEVEKAALRCMDVLGALGEPAADLRVGIALRSIGRTEKAAVALAHLAESLADADEPGQEAVLAYTLLELAQCEDELEKPDAAAAHRCQGQALAGQVLRRLAEKPDPPIFGWDEKMTAGLATALDAAHQASEK